MPSDSGDSLGIRRQYGAKLCYGRLCRYAGKRTYAFPSQERLAAALGKQMRQVQRYLQELISLQLLEQKQMGGRYPNRYYFLNHKWLGDKPNGASDTSDLSYQANEGDAATPDTSEMSCPEKSDTSEMSCGFSQEVPAESSAEPLSATGLDAQRSHIRNRDK